MKLQRTQKRMCCGISSPLAVDSSVSTSQLNEEDHQRPWSFAKGESDITCLAAYLLNLRILRSGYMEFPVLQGMEIDGGIGNLEGKEA